MNTIRDRLCCTQSHASFACTCVTFVVKDLDEEKILTLSGMEWSHTLAPGLRLAHTRIGSKFK